MRMNLKTDLGSSGTRGDLEADSGLLLLISLLSFDGPELRLLLASTRESPRAGTLARAEEAELLAALASRQARWERDLRMRGAVTLVDDLLAAEGLDPDELGGVLWALWADGSEESRRELLWLAPAAATLLAPASRREGRGMLHRLRARSEARRGGRAS